MFATYDDVTNWVRSVTGIMPVTRQLVRKDVQNATLQAGFVGFTSQSSMDHALQQLRLNPWYGSYRITVGISRDSKGLAKGTASRAVGPGPTIPKPSPPQQPGAAGGQGQRLSQPLPAQVPEAEDTTWVFGSNSSTIAVERGVQTTPAVLVEKNTQTMETMNVDQEVQTMAAQGVEQEVQTMEPQGVEQEMQTEVTFPQRTCIQERDDTHTLAPCSPTEKASSPTRSSPTQEPSDAPTCLEKEEDRAETERKLLQAKQELGELQKMKEELHD